MRLGAVNLAECASCPIRIMFRKLVEFVHEYCGQILSKEFKNHNFKSTADGATYQIEVTVKCSKANFDAELELRSREMSGPIVTGARWRTA